LTRESRGLSREDALFALDNDRRCRGLPLGARGGELEWRIWSWFRAEWRCQVRSVGV